jgi:hypothetical protein
LSDEIKTSTLKLGSSIKANIDLVPDIKQSTVAELYSPISK